MPDRDDTQPRTFDEPIIVGGEALTSADFEESFGEGLQQTLDLDTWRVGSDLSREVERVANEVREAIERETKLQKRIRAEVFPKIATQPKAPRNAGKHVADEKAIAKIHDQLLFRGGIEACDGAMQTHATLPLTIYQMGVTLVSYQGNEGTWCQRLFRRDLEKSSADPIQEAIAILDRRQQRSRSGDRLGELAQKAILTYAERAILLQRSKAPWRMGVGNPVTYELLTGGSNLEMMVAATNVLRDLVEKHQKFVFISREPREQMLLTIAHALRPMEFAIVRTLDAELDDWLHQRRYVTQDSTRLTWDAESILPSQWIPRFIEQVASKIVVGLFRASETAPAQIFYAHEDHADFAAHIALADSMLQKHRGVPMLIDIARHVCKTVFGDTLTGIAENAYAAAGVPWRYAH